MEQKKVKWGILGAGKIARRFLSSLKNHPLADAAAIAARNPEQAKILADEFQIGKIYSDFERLLGDEAIDAVYIALPHGLHARFTVKALAAGKAVLCEKPAVINQMQMLKIMQCAMDRKVLFMEAMKTRFVPAYRALFDLIVQGEIGEIQEIDVRYYSKFDKAVLENPDLYINQPKQGGILLDGGCYAVSYLSDFLPFEVQVKSIKAFVENGIDRAVEAWLDFQSIPAKLICSMIEDGENTAVIKGSLGTITVPLLHRPVSFSLEKDGEVKTFSIPYDNDDFYSQIDDFISCLLAGKKESDICPMVLSLQNARILDVLADEIRKGNYEPL